MFIKNAKAAGLNVGKAEMLALTDPTIAERVRDYKAGLGAKIKKANEELATLEYKYKVSTRVNE